jgi:hypothetical protein
VYRKNLFNNTIVNGKQITQRIERVPTLVRGHLHANVLSANVGLPNCMHFTLVPFYIPSPDRIRPLLTRHLGPHQYHIQHHHQPSHSHTVYMNTNVRHPTENKLNTHKPKLTKIVPQLLIFLTVFLDPAII